MASVTYKLLASYTTTANETTVIFNSIPQTYTDLSILISVRSGYTAGDMRLRINNLSTSIYSMTNLRSNGSNPVSYRYSTINIMNGNFNNTNTTSSTFSDLELYIPNYTSSVDKPVAFMGVAPDFSSTPYSSFEGYLMRDTNAVTSITLIDTFSTGYAAGSTFYLYGIKNA